MEMERQEEYATPPVERDAEVAEVEHTTSADVTDSSGESVEHSESSAEPQTIQLNLSPLIALVFGLGLGFVAGFVGRPYLLARSQPLAALPQQSSSQAATGSTPASAAPGPATPAPASAAQAAPTSAPASTSTDDTAAREAAAQTLMTVLSAQTRHFKGDPNAPVTIIEFSDFQ